MSGITRSPTGSKGMALRTRLALAALPAVFFSFVILVGFNILSMTTGSYGGTLAALGYVITFYSNGILGAVSLVCLYGFLRDTKETNPAWYLGIPLGIAVAIVTLAGIVVPALRSSMDIPHGIEMGAGIVYFSLPIFCALFFWSLKRESPWIPAYTAAALIVGILSFIVVYNTLFPVQYVQGEIHAGGSLSDGWAMLYLLFGLPFIGLFFPVIAGSSVPPEAGRPVNTDDTSDLP